MPFHVLLSCYVLGRKVVLSLAGSSYPRISGKLDDSRVKHVRTFFDTATAITSNTPAQPTHISPHITASPFIDLE